MRAWRRFSGVAAAALASGVFACSSGPECNQLSCYSGLEIRAVSPVLLAAGTYEIAVELDDVSGRCEIVFPRNTTQQSACDPGLPVTVHWQSAGFILSVFMRADDIGVRVSRDGELLGEATFQPEYITRKTDPTPCAPSCEVAPPEVFRLES